MTLFCSRNPEKPILRSQNRWNISFPMCPQQWTKKVM